MDVLANLGGHYDEKGGINGFMQLFSFEMFLKITYCEFNKGGTSMRTGEWLFGLFQTIY